MGKVNFIPGKGRVLISPDKKIVKTKSGLYLDSPEGSILPERGIVVAEEESDDRMYSVGDMVYFAKNVGFDISIDEELFAIIKNEGILGKETK